VHLGLEPFIPPALYLSFWAVVVVAIFWRPIVGIYYLVPLIPAQTFRDTLGQFPLGANVVSIVVIATAIGVLRKGHSILPKSLWRVPICAYIGLTLLSLIQGSFYLGRSLPFALDDPRFQNWRNYATILVLAFLVHATVTTKQHMKVVVLLICVSVLLLDKNFWETVRDRDYSSYSEDLRNDAGALGYAGVNGLAAFEAQIAIALLALGAYESKWLHWVGYVALAVFSTICLMYSLSRAGYVALLAGWLFLGLVKYRKMLILLIVFGMTWTTLVPKAVVERVFMTHEDTGNTEFDHSSETRLTLWEDAMQVFQSNPATGTGFDTYAYMERVGQYRDTHNIYIKVLVETGVVGLALFLFIIYRLFRASFTLARTARDPFHASLGLALASWLVCAVVGNFFGDRWTYLQVNGYMWVLAGLVARAADSEDDACETDSDPIEVTDENRVVQVALA
jgi:O-antigen ligase